MALFSARYAQIATVAESAFGTTPATPTFIIERMTPSDGLETQRSSYMIEEMHADPNIRGDVETKQDVAGTHNFLATYGTQFDTWLQRFLRGTWATNVLVNGDQRLPFTLEKKFLSGATAMYQRFLGTEVDSVSLNFEARKEITGQITFVGQKEQSVATSAISGATYTAANTNAISTGNSITTTTFFGLSTLPKIFSVSLNIAHGFQPADQLGSVYRFDQVPDLIRVTARIVAYIETGQPGDMTDLGLNFTSGDVNFTVGAVANNKYTFDLPATRILNHKITNIGQSGALRIELECASRNDASTGGTIEVTKAVA
jgi:hypothetical protein